MAGAVRLKTSTATWETPSGKVLDEAFWEAWRAKGNSQDKTDFKIRIKAMTWALMAALLCILGFGSRLATYDTVIRCLVAAGIIGLMANAIHNRHHSIAAIFGVLAILYNPVVPVFTFAGTWQRVLVILTAIPLAASLTRRDLKGAYIG